MTIDYEDSYPLTLLALVIWREAQGENYATKLGVACSIRNRVQNPRWWGHDWIGVILMPWQYSSFNHGDPNSAKFPLLTDPVWSDCMDIAQKVYLGGIGDTTQDATSYFDNSLDYNPPKWATDGSQVHTLDIGALHFYKLA